MKELLRRALAYIIADADPRQRAYYTQRLEDFLDKTETAPGTPAKEADR
jgi:hypothetical protein